ncbi:hypothetical protein L6164_025929 [Bauhinia variegata]|uniref:Uncharacterized protein n=1 Tax=Bauhinia variegata TaxID=167791 RepID=A0ACB9M318_BAUVA|nr:hypothetical protein L6164_025929 [Bauhinia variegata]
MHFMQLQSMDIEDIKKIYTVFILRGMISVSILTQLILFLWIFFRKGIPIVSIRRNLWFVVHLVGDYIASCSLGNIFQTSMTPDAGSQESVDFQINLLALWATFILLHLGGHNTITAFTLEDDQYWWIHLLKFLLYVGKTIIIFSLSVIKERISFCVLLLLFAGISKSCERILVINRGSISRRRRSARKNSHSSPRCLHAHRMDIEGEQQDPDTEATLLEAHQCFESHINIYIDHTTDVNVNVNGFNGLTTEKSIQFLEMELSFAYNMFYSKNVVIDKFWRIVSWLFRFISFFFIITAGILFFYVERHKPVKIDKAITITLLLKAVVLECGSFVVSLLSIDTLVMVAHPDGWIRRKLVSMIITCQNYLTPCTKVGQFNLLSYSIRDGKSCKLVKSFLQLFDFKEFSDNYRYSKHDLLDNEQRDLLFKEVRSIKTREQERGGMPAEVKQLNPVGYDIIQQLITGGPTSSPMGRDTLIESSERSFEERLLIYHVATELYYAKKTNHPEEAQENSSPEHGNASEQNMRYLEASKILSDYMLYLLVAHPSLLLPVLTPELRSYRDTRAAIVRFFQFFQDNDPYETMWTEYTRFSETDRVKYKNSVVLDGIKVSKYLTSKRQDDTGRLLCQLWLEMLCFAASQCKGQSHAKQLGKGRELFTIIWLYMIHLGISYQYVVQKTGNIFFVPCNRTAVAPQEGQSSNKDSTDVTSQRRAEQQ